MSELIKIATEKTPQEIIEAIKNKASEYNFIIREVFNMAKEFKDHGVKVENNFEYYSIMICNPEKAYQSILKNPIRGAVLLPPKQVVIYPENDKTIIAYATIEKKDVKCMLPDDEAFQKGLEESCNKIKELILNIK